MRKGTVYTETLVHAAPERFAGEAPYQIAIIDLEGGGRLTARIRGDRLVIGDTVIEADITDGVPFYRKI